MKTRVLFLTLLLLAITIAQLSAQTNIPSSIINQDVTWSTAGSPYTINGNLIIDNAKLSVEPGVKIIFNSDYSIRLRTNGTIYAKGTKLDSILITSTEQVHSGRFIFEDITTGTVTEKDTLFLSGSIFSFVKFDKLGLVGGYWRNTYWESYNGNFRGNVKLLFDHCAFTNLISGQYNDPRQYSYDLISHIDESIFNYCEFSKLKLGWGLIGNRARSKVSIYNSNFSQITKNGYGPLFIQNPFIKIVNSHFSDIQTNKFFAGFYTDYGDSLIVKNSSFSNITCYEQFQYLNHPVVELEKVLFQNITSPEFIRKDGLNEVYTINNSSFDQLSVEQYLFNLAKLTIRNSNFNLKDGQKISNTAENPNPVTTEFLGNNYWRINNQVITDTTYLHGLSINYYNDVTRDKIFFTPLNSSPDPDAPRLSKFSQTINFQALLDRHYGDDSFDLNATVNSGLPVSYTSSDSNVATVDGNKLTIVGVGTATITALQGGNNEFSAANSVEQTLTVKKANLTAIADDEIRSFGEANPVFSITYSGFKNGETSAVIDTAPSVSSMAITTSDVGTYPITVSGGTDNNYTFIYQPGTLNITKVPLTISAENKTRGYGDGNPAFTFSYTGFKNGETSTVIDSTPVGSSTAITTSDTGAYPITVSGGADNNYTFNYQPGTLNITKAPLTISADAKTRVYGEANPVFTFSYTGFKNGDTGTVIDTAPSGSSTAITTSDTGTYPITVSGGTDNNYTFTYQPGTLNITKAPLTVSAENNTRVYGEANPAFIFSYTGFKNGETGTVIDTAPTVSSAANTTSDVGAYPITVTGGSDNNYSFNYVSGTLTITKANQTITFNKPGDVSESVGTFELTAISSSKLEVRFESADLAKLTISGNTATINGPGNAMVKAVQTGNNNYEPATDVSQTFCILPRKPVITASGLGSENITLTSSSKSNIEWYKDGQLLSNQTGPDLQVDASGVYSVRCTVEGCSTDSDDFSLIITGVGKEQRDRIDLYPNPVRDELRLVVPDYRSGASQQVMLIDQSGRTVATQPLIGKETLIRVDGLAPGSYFVLVAGMKKMVYGKFVKQ